jgi:tRNA(fMet)-specific endonuclease VapC
MKSARPEENVTRLQQFFEGFLSVPFDDAAAETYGTIRTQLERAGTPLGPNDLYIAAIALSNNLVLLTHNSGEFQQVEGLCIEDWGLDEPPHVSPK